MVTNIKKYKYYSEVTYENNNYNIENEIMIKYKINTGKTFNNNEWTEIIDENNYYYFDRIAKEKLRRLLTENELRNFLFDLGANKDLIDKLVIKYKKYNFINDDLYTKEYISYRQYKEGPSLISKKLISKGISQEIINENLKNIDENKIITEKVESQLNKRIKQNKYEFQNKLKLDLIKKGYTKSYIYSIVDKMINQTKFDDLLVIEKDYQKLIRKYENKKTKEELNYFIKTKLYQKGYSKNDIEYIISKEKDN
ncbi:regulatory protein RecX [Haploplasma axanthum]|uniref:Regulatory protein RecX n=1 Tax=Haploplasma axanthum TaxID=29552 RepID=A0A449BDJ3_HAPAX|nr:RecX family transcriptional regulator [Haploplasma axanthum]VEU80516.1 recombination regulator RecX [Haploplasma axanthum]